MRFRLVNTRQAREAEARSGFISSGDTIPDRLGEFLEIRESKERIGIASEGIRPARLEPLALRAPGHERMANGWAAASGEKRIELSETIAWFGDILI